MDASIIMAIVVAWITLATLFAVIIGRSVKVGDEEARLQGARLRLQADSQFYSTAHP